ncbi:unnamed protein product [Linum tenue]|uniref:NB-ARC domain-containing protein n=1 Tax=Linum tenue TaxID=586396 RepID=A0AAV0IYF5_9ROSI|nr:unnamed protein product [Linum tenue]
MKARHRIAVEIQGIVSRIRDVSHGHQRLRQKLFTANSSDHTGDDALLVEKSDLVGIDEPKRTLVSWLTSGGSGREVISVTGMGGLGKTTLVKQVYDHGGVKKHFGVHAWIAISRSYKMEELLKDIVRQLLTSDRKSIPERVNTMHVNELKTMIKDILINKRYLIVLDDVWHTNEWDAVKYALPANDCGSRVMLTTRNADLAFALRIESEGKLYNLEPLPQEESWMLLCKKTFQGNPCPNYLEDICRSILRKCEGFPLAIVAVSGVIATKDKRRIDELEMVRRCLGAEIDGNNKLKNLKKVLSLSFNDLPYHLKSCFLYLSIFPEDYRIKRMRIIRLWVAEGFMEAKHGKELEDVAEDYLNELLSRSLLQVAEWRSDGRAKTYRIHDLVREIIISKSREQNFAVVAKDKNNIMLPDKIRRLSVHNTLQNVHGFMLLNVLDLQGTSLKNFPVQVMNLYYLKYLSLKNTRASSGSDGLMTELGKLAQLRRLGVLKLRKKDGRLEMLPHWIPNLHSLVRLHLKWNRLNEDPLESLQVLPNLVHLELLQVYEGETLHFRAGGFKKLKLLGIDKFDGLRRILIDVGAMPCVEKLWIQRCKLLEEVPLGIEHLTRLKVLEFFDMPQDLIKTLSLNEPEGVYSRVAHIPEVYATYWREAGWEVHSLDSCNCSPRPNHVIRNEELHPRWK